MGWTSTDARYYTESGKVDRKAECDHLYSWEDERTKTEVLKSAMKGAIYYAAVRTIDKTSGESEVWAAVCITSTKRDGWFNFGYKNMSEDCGPYYCDCPKGILVLLTETNNEYAKEWREKCWANIKTPKKSLASVKIGEIIEFENGGQTIRAEKMAPAYQFKTPWFKRVGKDFYIKKNHIKNWRLVQAEEEAQQTATPAEAPQISAETSEAVNISADSENGEQTRPQQLEPAPNCHRLSQQLKPHENIVHLPQPTKSALQSPQIARAVNYATPTHTRRQRANKQANSVFRKLRTARNINFVTPRKWSAANSPPILVAPTELPTGSINRIF